MDSRTGDTIDMEMKVIEPILLILAICCFGLVYSLAKLIYHETISIDQTCIEGFIHEKRSNQDFYRITIKKCEKIK